MIIPANQKNCDVPIQLLSQLQLHKLTQNVPNQFSYIRFNNKQQERLLPCDSNKWATFLTFILW